MIRGKFKTISKIMLLAFTINLLPISYINTFAESVKQEITQKENVVMNSEKNESIYGPYNGSKEDVHAYDPFKETNEQIEGYEYSDNTLLIKTKDKLRLFNSSGVSNSSIESMEVIDISFGNAKTFSSNNDGTWFKAKLKTGSDIEQVMNEVKLDNDVLAVEPEYIRKLEANIPTAESDESMSEQWYLDTIGVTDAWNHLEEQGINPGGSRDVIVAVIDTGVDYTHPDLAANIWTNPMEIAGNGIDDDNNGYVDDVHGATTIVGQTHEEPMDYNGHGTHVAGIIAAESNNGIGGAGIAYNVQIMPIKAAQDGGVLTSSDIARAIIYAAENGADVINMSFGGYGRSIIEEDALAMAFSTSALVAAGGNDGIANEATLLTPTGKPMYPAAYSWVLGVMASSSTANGRGDWLSSFSNWDINTENSLEYELMAPGSKIFSTLPNNQYAKWDGTSMAAPVVSAIAALVRSKFDDKDTYSSRFIMGQLASTGNEKQGKTYSNDANPKYYNEVSAINALTQTPEPNVTYIEHYLFDKSDVESTTAGDGIVDAGETVDIGMVIRNHWGKAEDVNVTIDAVLPSGASDPYVEIINNTINYGAIGNFGTDDNGFIYENDVVVGVNHPFTVKVKENAPNDHYVKLNVTITAKNGFDSNDSKTYTTEDAISFVIRKGTVLPSVIDTDMTLTKDKYWIIPNATVIEPNVTVNIEAGTQVQFWASEPEDPYAEKPMAYLQVKGNLFVNGTAEEPVEMFASSMWRGYEVKIFTGNNLDVYQDYYQSGNGNVELNYAKITNPNLNVNSVNNCYFTQDEYTVIYKRYLDNGKVQTETYAGPVVLSKEIFNSKFYKLGYKYYDTHTTGTIRVDGTLKNNIFDNCYYYFDDKVAENNVFLNNYKLASEQYGDREYWTSQGNNFGTTVGKDVGFEINTPEKFNYTGSTYVGVYSNLYEMSYEGIDESLIKEFAEYLGGNIAEANDETEQYFIDSYASRSHISSKQVIEIPGISYVEYVTLNNSKLELGAGGASNKLIASIYPNNSKNKSITWVSSNPEIATVDNEGNVTPLIEGTTTITVTTEDGGYTSSCEVFVKTIVPANGIKLNKTELILEKGTSEQLVSEILPVGATDKRVEWISFNEDVATVDEFGNVTAKELGTAKITVKALDGNFTASCDVNVVIPVTGIEVDNELLRLVVGGEKVKLNAQVIPENASIQDIIWTTSDEVIATVDEEGYVTPIKEGTVMVTAKSKDGGFKKNVIVTVWETEYSFNPIKVSASESNTVILNDDGSLWMSGMDYKNTPILLSTNGVEGKIIDAVINTNYSGATYVLTDKGYVYQISSNQSFKVNNLNNIVKISIGADHLLALKNDGTVWAKGYNNYGQLGDGTTNTTYDAIQVDGLTDIVDISAGNNSSAAVKADGSLYTWGENQHGMLGLGHSENRLIPTKVNNIRDAKEVEVNYNSIFYISKASQLYRSGYLWNEGEVKNFTFIDNNVVSVDASYADILYVKEDGSLYVGGYNNNGSLGIGNTDSSYIMKNENISDVKSVHSGYSHNIVIKNDGSVYAFGRNDYGQLGNMSTTNSSLPVQVLLGILPDDVNPTIAKTYPTSGQNRVELNPIIAITFDETVNSSSKYGQIRLKDDEGNILSIKNKKIDGKTLSFEPISDLQYGKTYTIEIPEDAVVDMFGNGNYSHNFSFIVKNEGLLSLIKKAFSKASEDEQASSGEDKEIIDSVILTEDGLDITELIKSVEADITIEEINAKAEEFFTDDKKSQIKNNAILNRWWDPNVDHWMRFTAPSGDNNSVIYMSGNYWGTTSETLIGKSLIDYEDFKSLAKIKYQPVLETAPETAYPFVTNIYLTNSDGTTVNKVGAEKVNVHVEFNRDMNTAVEPTVTFGPDMPTTDYRVTTIEEGGWISSREWVGQINITPMTGDGYQFFRVIGGEASDNSWLVSGDDRERFRFEIITSGVESMNLQAEGNGNKIKLSWFQDDFDTLAGYNIYRAESEDGYYEKINKAIVPSHIKTFEDTKVEPGKTYYYKFTVLQTDMSESDYSNIASAAAVDSILPTIEHNAVTEASAYMPVKITANVTDNVLVKGVSLYFRKVGETEYKKREMTNLEGTRYSSTIEGSNVTPVGVEYYIEATDGTNVATVGNTNNPYKINIADKPKVTAISPAEGSDIGGTKVSISGTNFKDGAKVYFNGVEATNVIVESSTRVTAITPSNNAGTVDVKVENSNGGFDTLYNAFTYTKEGIALTVNNSQGKKGDVIEVPVEVNYIDGLTAGDFTFEYDSSVLQFIEATGGDLTSEFMVAGNEVESGKVNISMAGTEAANGMGNILYIKLQVLDEPLSNSSVLTLSKVELNGGAIQASISNGQFNILEGHSVYGNVYYHYNYQSMNDVKVMLNGDNGYHDAIVENGYYTIRDVYDGNYQLSAVKNEEANAINSITSYDASLVLQAAVGKNTLGEYQKIAADVNSDGKVNSVDASLILAYSAGKTSLPFQGSSDIWKFETYNRNITVSGYDSYGNNLYGILLGDVSGNWNSMSDPEVRDSKADFNIGSVVKNDNGTFTVPVTVSMENANLFGTDIIISYDSSVNKLVSVEKASSISNFGIEYSQASSGEIKVSLAGEEAFDSSDRVLNLVFESTNKNNLVATTVVEAAEVNERNVTSVVYGTKDMNDDKEVNILDVADLALGYNASKDTSGFIDKRDINKDGIIDIFDLIQVSRVIE